MADKNYHRYLFTMTALLYAGWGVLSHYFTSLYEPIWERTILMPFILLFAYASPKLLESKYKLLNSIFASIAVAVIVAHYCSLIGRSFVWNDGSVIPYSVGYLVVISSTAFFITSKEEWFAWLIITIAGTWYTIQFVEVIPFWIYLSFVATMIFLITAIALYLMILSKKLEVQRQERMQNSNLVTIGKMSSILSHEVNNHLQVINTLLYSLKHKGMIEEAKYDKIHKSSHKLTQMLESICSLSLNKNTQKNSFFLMEKLSGLMNIYQTKIKELDGQYKIEIAENIKVNALGEDFGQAFINIVRNFIDHRDDSKPFELAIVENNGRLMIEGTSMPIEQNLENKIFDPFITTKDINEGAGLGLTISRNLLRQNGLELNYCVGKIGPCFIIDLGDSYES